MQLGWAPYPGPRAWRIQINQQMHQASHTATEPLPSETRLSPTR